MSARHWDLHGSEDLQPKTGSARVKLVTWAFFAVVVSLLPILLTMIGTMTHGQPVPPVGPSEFEQALSRATDYERALARGDLLLIAGALAAGGLGEIVARGTHRNRGHRIFAGGWLSAS